MLQAGDLKGAAVAAFVHHDHLSAGGILPAEETRYGGNSGTGVDTDMQKSDTGLRQQGDDGAGMPGHIGHFRGGGASAEAGIEGLREGQAKTEEIGVHQLGMGGEGQRVPGNITGEDALLHHLSFRAGGLLQVLVDQPGAGGPDEFFMPASFAHFACHAQGGRDIFLEIILHHHPGEIGKTDVEVGFENEMNLTCQDQPFELVILMRGRSRTESRNNPP